MLKPKPMNLYIKVNTHVLNMLKDVGNKANTALHLAQSNYILQTKNAEKIESIEFDVSSWKNEIEELKKKNQDLCDENDNTSNGTMEDTDI